jgi:hypothetical protein
LLRGTRISARSIASLERKRDNGQDGKDIKKKKGAKKEGTNDQQHTLIKDATFTTSERSFEKSSLGLSAATGRHSITALLQGRRNK